MVNKRKSLYSNDELNTMDIITLFKLRLDGSITKFPPGFWQQPEARQNSVSIVKYLIEEILGWDECELKKKFSSYTLYDYKLSGMSHQLYNDSPFKIIDAVYPRKFKPWDFKNVPIGYWTDENVTEAMNWLIEEKLQWNMDGDGPFELTRQMFRDVGLFPMLTQVFKGSTFLALDSVYPNRFKPWEVTQCPLNFWTKTTAKEAVKWLLEEKFQFDDEDIKLKCCYSLFKENGLSGLLCRHYGGSIFALLDDVYPNRFKPWELSKCPQRYWTKETAREAIIWLIEVKLKLIHKDVCKSFGASLLNENGLGSLLCHFDFSPFKLLDNAYPNEYRKEDLKGYRGRIG